MKTPIWKKKSQKQKNKPPKSKLREWIDSIIFAVIAATILRWLVLSSYAIPSSSMEGTQLTGDYLFVSKLHYGTRTPQTPLRLPLTDNKIWGTKIPSYLNWIQLPSYRLPGISSIKRNDIVVFNWPADSIPRPTDMKTNYIKRCLAIAGDTFQIKNAEVFVNGKKAQTPPDLHFSYQLVTTHQVSQRVFREYDIYFGGENSNFGTLTKDNQYMYYLFTTPANIQQLRKRLGPMLITAKILSRTQNEASPQIYPTSYWHKLSRQQGKPFASTKFSWNQDNFGALVIPQQGRSIPMTRKNIILYGPIIKEYEYHKTVEIASDFSQITIDGKAIKTYTFKQDYYFMVGDSRHNSIDSRYWGFVPKDHVVGKAWFTWLSLNPNLGLFEGKIRWNKMLKAIR
ncbi:S26 family signal peptidase [marine bacterium AO1-C]|nr:S26 family signal peptidase [marine bacterium AO1-C]